MVVKACLMAAAVHRGGTARPHGEHSEGGKRLTLLVGNLSSLGSCPFFRRFVQSHGEVRLPGRTQIPGAVLQGA